MQIANASWMSSKTHNHKVVVDVKISKEDATRRISALQKGISKFISVSQDLYSSTATSELSSIIIMAENIERELKKLK